MIEVKNSTAYEKFLVPGAIPRPDERKRAVPPAKPNPRVGMWLGAAAPNGDPPSLMLWGEE